MTDQSSVSSQPINAVIYACVSTDEQAKGYSLSTQVEGCSQYASLKGYHILSIFKVTTQVKALIALAWMRCAHYPGRRSMGS